MSSALEAQSTCTGLIILCIAADTLAGASGQSLDTLLDRVGNRRMRAMAAKVSTVIALGYAIEFFILS